MKSGESIMEKSRNVEDLHELRLMAPLHELVRDKRRMEAAKALGIDHRTLTTSLEGGRLSSRVRVVLEKALLSGAARLRRGSGSASKPWSGTRRR